MKYGFLYTFAAIILLFYSCESVSLDQNVDKETTPLSIQTKSIMNENFIVSMEDVESFLKFKRLSINQDITILVVTLLRSL